MTSKQIEDLVFALQEQFRNEYDEDFDIVIMGEEDDRDVQFCSNHLEYEFNEIIVNDMLDDELIDQMRRELPDGVPTVFISAVAGQGLEELKDMLWTMLNDESNRIQTFTHRNLDLTKASEDDYEEADPYGHDDYIIEGVASQDLIEEDWDDE